MKKILTILLSCSCLFTAHAFDERIYLNAKINGQPVQFIFDTGWASPSIAIYPEAARKLGLKVKQPDYKLSVEKGAIGVTESCDLDFGATNFQTSIPVIEIPSYLKWNGDGIIGWQAISNNIFSLDTTTLGVALVTNVPTGQDWIKLKISTNSLLALEISTTQSITIDTGASKGITFHPQKWQKWKTAHINQMATLDAYYMPDAGMVVKEEEFAHEISIGPLTLSDVPITEANQTELSLNPQFEASFGLAALKRLDIIVDGKHGIAYLRPKKTKALPYDHNRLGAVFTPKDLQSDDLVAHVVSGSPAFEAGIRNDDLLLKIGALDATEWRTDPNVLPLTRFWNSPAGTKLELTLKRGDKIFKTTATLRNIIPPDAPKNSN